jgi:hypothetical protein
MIPLKISVLVLVWNMYITLKQASIPLFFKCPIFFMVWGAIFKWFKVSIALGEGVDEQKSISWAGAFLQIVFVFCIFTSVCVLHFHKGTMVSW